MSGLQGEIQVAGKSYNNLMPGFNYLDDSQLAVILSYVRQRFGDGAGEVSAEEIASSRVQDQ